MNSKEENLINLAKNGDSEAIAIMYEKYRTKIYKFIFSKIKNESVAEDLLQDTFIKVHNNLKFYRKEDGNFYNFILINAKQIIIEYYRKISLHRSKIEDNADIFIDANNGTLEDITEGKEEEELLRKIIDDLPESQAMAIKLVYMKNLSYKQAAKVMGKTELSIKSLIHRAKKSLKEKMLEKYPEMEETTKVKVLKMLIISALCASMVTGIGYATVKIYEAITDKHKFTLSELLEQPPETASDITKEEALEKINYYLEVLGEQQVLIDEVKFAKNPRENKLIWMVKNQEFVLIINSSNGNLERYVNFGNNKNEEKMDLIKLYEKLRLPSEYEIYDKEQVLENEIIRFAKKYDNVFNKYESVNMVYKDNVLKLLFVCEYKPENTEVTITKEVAEDILRKNNIDYDAIVLEFECDNMIYSEKFNGLCEEINEQNVELEMVDFNIRLVWKVKNSDKEIYWVDAQNGDLIRKNRKLEGEKKE